MDKKDKELLLKILGYRDKIEKKANESLKDSLDNLIHSRRISKIKKSGRREKLLEISYTDKKSNQSKRIVEPYKLTDTDFWGYDIEKDSIRRFKTSSINGIKPKRKKFTPRWDIEMPN